MYLFFDTETTGLSRNSDHIVQVAWILANGDGEIETERCCVIRPNGYSIPRSAAQIHGITTAIAEDIGEPLPTVLNDLSTDVRRASVLVAHNLSFDLGILQNDYKNARLGFPFHGKTQICTMKLSTTWCRLPKLNGSPGFKWPSLQELHYRLFGEAFDDAHDALADARACLRCYVELVRLRVITPPKAKRQKEAPTVSVSPKLAVGKLSMSNIDYAVQLNRKSGHYATTHPETILTGYEVIFMGKENDCRNLISYAMTGVNLANNPILKKYRAEN